MKSQPGNSVFCFYKKLHSRLYFSGLRGAPDPLKLITPAALIQSAARLRDVGMSGSRLNLTRPVRWACAVCLLIAQLLLCHQTGRAAAGEPANSLTIAAAADLGPALRDLAMEFKKRSGAVARVVLGSSGNLATQIEQGAPYDVFLSADTAYASRLVKSGHAVPHSLTPYAQGFLVLWTASASVDVRRGWEVLDYPAVKKIAIANPAHAPYGRAAKEALTNARLYNKVSAKLVLGENVAQAAQFVISGNAQAGLIPLSLALAPEMRSKGAYWEVPHELYSPIHQAGIVVRSSPNRQLAEGFMKYLKSPEAAAILRRYGFEPLEAP